MLSHADVTLFTLFCAIHSVHEEQWRDRILAIGPPQANLPTLSCLQDNKMLVSRAIFRSQSYA